MSVGALKVSLVNVALTPAKNLTGDNTVVELVIGSQKSLFFGAGKHFQSKEVALFGTEKHHLDIFAYSEGQRDVESIVYGQVNLTPLFNLPKTRHIINVQTIYFSNSSAVDQSSGSIDIEVIYSQTLDSLLQVNVESAVLIRDTEVVGKMDPYVEVTLEQVTKKTTVKDEAGKTPEWNETLIFILKNPQSKLVIVVKDLDVTTSDLVGTVELDLRERGFLVPNNEWAPVVLDIFYKGKVAGTIKLSLRFAINNFLK